MVKVMIAEDNINENSMYCEFLTKDKDIQIVSVVLDGEAAVTEYLAQKPDVLILDLNLPKLNGIEVIEKISLDSNEKNKCNIIIVTGYPSMSADFYSVQKIYRFLHKPCNLSEILDSIKEISSYSNELSCSEIKDLLYELHFNMSSRGVAYLVEAIQLAYSNPEFIYNISNLYKIVGLKNSIKENKISRSIRNSIDVMNCHISKDLLCSFFRCTAKENVTPKHFFEIVIDYFNKIKNEEIPVKREAF